MTDIAVGKGDALSPTILVENNPAALEAALAAAKERYAENEPQRQVAAATERVKKAQEALDAAQITLAAVMAEFGG